MLHDFIGELLGTMTLITLGCGVVANVCLSNTKGENSGWMVITTGWFIAVVMGVFVAQSAQSPNADINPAVSIAKYCLGFYSLEELGVLISAQLIGAFIGATLVMIVYWPHWRVTKNPALKLAVFCTAPAIRQPLANVLSETIGTAFLVFGVSAIFGQARVHLPGSGMGPYLVGVLVWGIGLSLGGPTGYALNPARDFAPRLAHFLWPIPGKSHSDWGYAWVPVIGPIIGGIIGALCWELFFGLGNI